MNAPLFKISQFGALIYVSLKCLMRRKTTTTNGINLSSIDVFYLHNINCVCQKLYAPACCRSMWSTTANNWKPHTNSIITLLATLCLLFATILSLTNYLLAISFVVPCVYLPYRNVRCREHLMTVIISQLCNKVWMPTCCFNIPTAITCPNQMPNFISFSRRFSLQCELFHFR